MSKKMDIVDRLDDMHNKRYNSNWEAWVQAQCSEGAKEIRKLRHALAVMKEARGADKRLVERVVSERDVLSAETVRLRGVMEDCVEGHDDCCNYVCNKIKEALEVRPC